MKTITQIQTIRQVGLLFATTSRTTIRQDVSASDGWLDFYTYAKLHCINEADGSPRL